MSVKLASLPNSRIKPRPSTSQSDTSNVTVGAGQTLLVLAANPNRTIATLENTSTQDEVYLGYGVQADAQAPSGLKLPGGSSYDVESPEDLFINNRSGAPVTISIDQGSG